MSPIRNRGPSLLLTPLIFLSVITVQAAPDDIEAVAKPKKNPGVRHFVMDDNAFEANLFNPHGSAAKARSHIELKLKLQIEEIQRECELNEDQLRKLRLAAITDIKKYFDQIDVVRAKFKAMKNDQEGINNIWQEMHPLQTKLANGLFGEASFFAKTLVKVMSPQQFEKYNSIASERRRLRYRSSIEGTMVSLESSVPLRHDQHKKIVEMLVSDTPVPRLFGQFDQHLVLYRLAKLPEDKLKPLLTARQWTRLEQRLQNNRGMEQFLVQQGLLQEDEREAKVAKKEVGKVLVRQRPLVRQEQPADAAQPENQKSE